MNQNLMDGSQDKIHQRQKMEINWQNIKSKSWLLKSGKIHKNREKILQLNGVKQSKYLTDSF